LKVASGKEISVGGATLAQSFIDLDLIDEYRVIVYPTLLGGGKPMFGDLTRQVDLSLVESRSFASGVVVLIYRPTNREV
ncbi:dihydrofolate reductase family protein, partial [Oceanobacillus sp. CFH 90083]|uniref:dihydrofolate reductase family protein n=1 Tax=Oceanobacillus sp. CFH 90083 TaxID=2592336 RepID=UPI00188472FF